MKRNEIAAEINYEIVLKGCRLPVNRKRKDKPEGNNEHQPDK